jgi:hypothetical protein
MDCINKILPNMLTFNEKIKERFKYKNVSDNLVQITNFITLADPPPKSLSKIIDETNVYINDEHVAANVRPMIQGEIFKLYDICMEEMDRICPEKSGFARAFSFFGGSRRLKKLRQSRKSRKSRKSRQSKRFTRK